MEGNGTEADVEKQILDSLKEPSGPESIKMKETMLLETIMGNLNPT